LLDLPPQVLDFTLQLFRCFFQSRYAFLGRLNRRLF
jgi:hypothetical protein